LGRIARVQDLANRILTKTADQRECAHVAFIAELAPSLTVVGENDSYFHAVGIRDYGDEKKIRTAVDEIVKTIKRHGQPLTIEQLHDQLSYEHPSHVRALASVSKLLAHLKDSWGLVKWPTVNPKNIRDKIYVIWVRTANRSTFPKSPVQSRIATSSEKTSRLRPSTTS